MKMRIFGVRNLVAKMLIFTLLVYFYAWAESISSEVEDAEEDDSKALGAELTNTLQDQSGLVKMMQFFDSHNENFSKMDQRMANLERMVKDGKEELKKEMNERMDRLEKVVKDGLEQLKNEIQSDVSEKNNALESVGALRHEQLHQEISLGEDDFVVSDAVASTITKIPQNHFRTSTDCGGNVELVRGAPSAIRFTNPGNNQSCAWKILAKVNFASTGIKFQSLGTETSLDGVRINYVDSSANLQSQKVTELESWIPIPTPHVIITFCPNPVNVSSGFEASIHGFGTSGDVANHSKPSWFGNSTETFDFSVSEDFADCMATQTPLKTSTDCGGNLELGRGAPSTIRFPNPGDNQSCVWTISPHGNITSYRLKFQSLSNKTLDNVVRINYLDSSAKLHSQKVTEVGSWIPILAPFVLITFCSHPSQVSSGFEASILGFGSSGDAPNNLKPSWFGNSRETFDLLVSQNFADCIPTQKYLTTSTDCGGLLGVVDGVPSTIRYPNSGNYSLWDCCAWTLVPAVKFASFQMKFQSFGMDQSWDGVKIYYWNSTLELKSEKVTEFGSWISIPAPYAVITFCSDSEIEGGGFGASILGLGTSTDSAVLKPFWLTNWADTFSYPPGNSSTGSSNEIVSVVVQQPNSQDSIVSLSVYQIGNDNIKAYELHCHLNEIPISELAERSGGGRGSWATYSQPVGNYHPILVIFKSNSRNSGERFTISY